MTPHADSTERGGTAARVIDAGFVPIPDMIAAHAAQRPHDVAFIDAGEQDMRLDWAALHQRVMAVAQALVMEGVRPRDTVAVLGPPSLPFAECLFGIVAARACVVPLTASATAPAIESLLNDCEPRLVFLDPAAEPAQQASVERVAHQRGVRVVRFGDDYTTWRSRATDGGALSAGQADDPFNIIYSSGTTGMPKGIVHLHGMRQRQASRRGFGFGPEGRTLLSTPMYSNTTLMPMLGTVCNGGTVVLMRRFDAGQWLATAARERITQTMLVPVQYQRLLAHPDVDRHDLSSLVVSQCTGAPMSESLKRELRERWPGRFIEVYGMTEGGPSFFLDAQEHPDKLHTVGKPGHGTEAFLIDEAGCRLPPDPSGCTAGEVVGHSPFMMAGYHRRPEATAEIRWVDEDGKLYHRSGDIGRFDAEGFLVLLDRKKDVIISGGQNIYAADLETLLAAHPDVQESAVIGVPSDRWGETPLALVVPRPGADSDAQALRDWVNAQVGKTQRLHAVELREELPRSALGKVSKKELRAPYWTTAGQPAASTHEAIRKRDIHE